MKNLPEPSLISSQQELVDVLQILKNKDYFSIDTEFIRTDTFYPNLGLIQLSDGKGCWLIDPLCELELTEFAVLLENPQVVKVFHSCSEDIEVLQHSLGCTPQGIFDTQVAAALTGFGFSRGYAGLAEEVLGVNLGKHETRSDWLKRPLTESQLRYAAEDVHYLIYLYQVIAKRLDALGRSPWMLEEMQRLEAGARTTVSTNEYYLKVKGAWKLDQRSLGTLQILCDWREQEARQRNRPRRRIIDDKSLLETAIHKPRTLNGITQVTNIFSSQLRKYGEQLIALVDQGLSLKDESLPPLMPKPIPREMGSTLKRLKQLVTAQAEKLSVPVEILAKKADLEQAVRAVVYHATFPDRLGHGWRKDLVGQPIRDLLEGGTGE